MNKKKIIPTIFALDKKTFQQKLNALSFAPLIHLDFMDGIFTDKKTISIEEMGDIVNYENKFQIHLMANEPLDYISKIKKLRINMVFIHFEAFETDSDLSYTIDCFKEKGFEVGLVLNPTTQITEAQPYFDEVDAIMLMSVWPGKEGQDFISNTYERLTELRKINKKITVYVDGGIKDSNVSKIIDVGADCLCIGSYISSIEKPKDNYKKIIDLVK